jgi:hypothetical protein
MSELELPGFDPTATGMARALRPQADRLRWEREWLQQNRFTQQPGAGSERIAAQTGASQAVATAAQSTGAAASATPTAYAATANSVSGTALSAVSAAPTGAVIAAPATGAAGAAAWIAVQRPLAAAPVPRADTAGSAGTFQRGDARQFALWYAEHGVAVALRLPPEQQRSASTLQSIRQWVKDAGLKLATLIINGEVRWRSTRPRSDGY